LEFGSTWATTYNKTASIIIAIADAVLELLSTAEITSKTKMIVHIVDLITFMMRNARGFNLCRARRMISVIVRMRQRTIIDIQTGIILEQTS
jgi:hypothetical protein